MSVDKGAELRKHLGELGQNRAGSNDPAGDVELGDEELEAVAGGNESTECVGTLGCCNGLSNDSPNTCCCDTWWPGCGTEL